MSEMPDKVWIDTVELDDTNTMRVHGTCPPDSPEPGDIEYLRNPYGNDGVVVSAKALDSAAVKVGMRAGQKQATVATLEAKLAEVLRLVGEFVKAYDHPRAEGFIDAEQALLAAARKMKEQP